MSSKTKSGGKISLDTANDELSDEQLAKASGGQAINAGVVAKGKLTVATGMISGSIASNDTYNGGDMPDPATG